MGEDLQTPKLQQICANFLSNKKVVVADPSGSSRNGIAQCILGMGAKTPNLLCVDNFNEAVTVIRGRQPEIIVVEYSIGNNKGLSLSEETQAYRNREEKIFVLVTANSSQSAVAQAAEEDVDAYILKPFTVKGCTDILTRTILSRICPSEYVKIIRSGKCKFELKDLDGALADFEKAISLKEKPTLAFYYRARTELLKNLLPNAEVSYHAGLQFDKLHYKCLIGLCDLLMLGKRYAEAYDIVKIIATRFPITPGRLGQVMSLAITTGNYQDIDQYYEIFKEIEDRSDQMVRHICASLTISGKYYLKNNNPSKGLECLKKAMVSAAGRTALLREIVSVLVEGKLMKEASEVLTRFPSHSLDANYTLSHFMVKILFDLERSKLIPKLQSMIKEGVKEPMIWYWLAYHLAQEGKVDEAEGVCNQAIEHWPEKVEYFEGALASEGEDEL